MMKRLLLCLLPALLAGCLSVPNRPDSPVPLARDVDLPHFMGDWYVIAHIPPSLDLGAQDAVESYAQAGDGEIAITYTRRDGPGGDLKVSHPEGHVVDGTGNALWGVEFVPFVRAEYRIAYLSPDYAVTIIGRSDLDYVWLMSRSPSMDEAEYQGYVAMMKGWGYDTSHLVRIPHKV